jgi:Zn-dependent protease with chaperone function
VIPVQGRFFDGKTTAAHAATLSIGADGFVRIEGDGWERSVRLQEVEISDRIASVPRRVRFADGAVFETSENDAIDTALLSLGQHTFHHDVARWERRWPIALVSLVLIAVVSWAFVVHGVPAIANVAARVLPPSVDRAIGAEGLDILDRMFFEPSKLPEARRKALAARFRDMTAPLKDGHDYRLEFRSAGEDGANAFALPSGIIVMTDELVALAQRDEELVAVLAHEIGHVRGRHGLRMILQSAGVSVLALAVLGDLGSASALAALIPGLIHAKHSRAFETEADEFAKQWLRDHAIDESHFDSMLCRLADGEADDDEDTRFDFLSSHPPTSQRAKCAAPAAAE